MSGSEELAMLIPDLDFSRLSLIMVKTLDERSAELKKLEEALARLEGVSGFDSHWENLNLEFRKKVLEFLDYIDYLKRY